MMSENKSRSPRFVGSFGIGIRPAHLSALRVHGRRSDNFVEHLKKDLLSGQGRYFNQCVTQCLFKKKY